jgi:probable phosphoglycerate mutase
MPWPGDGGTTPEGWPASCCGWLLRHGVTDGNAEGRVQGQGAGTGLSRLGERQVRAAAARVLRTPVRPAAIVSSDLERCRQTAQVLAEALDLPVRLDPDLRERSFGLLEGRLWADLPPAAAGVADGWVTSPSVRPPHGESVDDLAVRVFRALRRAASGPGPVLIVTHGGPIRVATGFGRQPRSAWPAVPHAVPLGVCLRDLPRDVRDDRAARPPVGVPARRGRG